MKKEKIGIITWHYYHNFGSALQAYALQNTIDSLGFNTKIINYRNPKYGTYDMRKQKMQHIAHVLLSNNKRIGQHFAYPFQSFVDKYLKETRLVQDEKELLSLCSGFQSVVCGSDQIWAPNVLNKVYLLEFVPKGVSRISYAASIGLNELPEHLKPTYSSALEEFKAISVRERKGAEIIKEACGIDAEVVLDPTFLIDVKHWMKMENAPYNFDNGDYLFCYFLKDDHSYKESVIRFAKKHNYRIVGYSSNIDDKEWMQQLKWVGPNEFLWLIHHSAAVITDSYHATIFSLIYHKAFITFERFKHDEVICQNSRLSQLKEYFGVDKNIYTPSNEIDIRVSTADIKSFEDTLLQLRNKSLLFLKSNLR